ncbi:hypothetical protein [Streptomyces sp. Inha503]|uniref:hypothetical protein n=1 Tax=Streptomyces sp. Inha503 TaxID=3383314 RepID=UPI0039A32CE2
MVLGAAAIVVAVVSVVVAFIVPGHEGSQEAHSKSSRADAREASPTVSPTPTPTAPGEEASGAEHIGTATTAPSCHGTVRPGRRRGYGAHPRGQ